jgi:UDP-N-acetyl-D-mannosaminuronic acid dehydrogenase
MAWWPCGWRKLWFNPAVRDAPLPLGTPHFKEKDDVKDSLLAAIESKTANVVVLGLGYVGLPVACLFAEAGFPVVGIRRNQDKVDMINGGECPIKGKEPGLTELVSRVVSEGRFRATTDYEACQNAQIVLIAVETPVDPVTKEPGYEALRKALTDLGPYLSPGMMVIIESTIAPGTMTKVVKPILEETSGLLVNKDFYLANCPERVMPGKLLANIRGCHRVVGGMSPETAELAVKLYRHVVQEDLDPVDCLTAELVKTMENTYRDVQIAFANEMALLCKDMGADVWQIRELVNKSPYRNMHLPGAGVGGHCLPKDPWLLVVNSSDGFEPQLTPAAREINDGMPGHMAALIEEALAEAGRELVGARVALLGVAYLENSDDTRNTPAATLAKLLLARGAEVVAHDPYVRKADWHQALDKGAEVPLTNNLGEALNEADCVALVTKHQDYRALDLKWAARVMRTSVLVDGRNSLDSTYGVKAGFVVRTVGRG